MPRPSVLVQAFLVVSLAMASPTATAARGQDETPTPGTRETGREVVLRAGVRGLPEAPAVLRLARTTLAPGALLATADAGGPSFVAVETGSPILIVDGDAVALPAGEGSSGRVPVPIGEPVTLQIGDRLAFPAETPRTFRNDGSAEVGLLIASVISDSDAFTDAEADGVSSETLGQGTAEALPETGAITLERLVLVEGIGVPAYDGPVLVAVEAGGFASTVETGDVQLSEGGAPGEPVEADNGESIAVRPGDALFFPNGMAATPPLVGDGEVVVLRFGIVPIEIGTPRPTEAIPVESEVRVTNDDVRLRDAPSLDGALVASLAAGQRLTVIGPPEDGDGVRWYPVADAADPTIAGYVSADFIEAVDEAARE